MGNAPLSCRHDQTSEEDSRRQSLIQFGNQAYQREDYTQAIHYHSRALQDLSHHPSSGERAQCLDYLCKEHWRVGSIDQALAFSQESLAVKQSLSKTTTTASHADSIAKTLSDMGCIFYERGDYDQALDFLQQALEMRQHHVPETVSVAVSCTNLALVYSKLGKTTRARELHQQACAIREALQPGSMALARTYMNLSSHCYNSSTHEQQQQAWKYLEKSEAIVQTIRPAPLSLMASLEVQRGNLLLLLCQQEESTSRNKYAADAIACYELAICTEERVAPDSLILASMYTRLARACEEEAAGLLEEARAARAKSLQIYRRKSPGYLETKKTLIAKDKNGEIGYEI